MPRYWLFDNGSVREVGEIDKHMLFQFWTAIKEIGSLLESAWYIERVLP
jgi:hypothetical protein